MLQLIYDNVLCKQFESKLYHTFLKRLSCQKEAKIKVELSNGIKNNRMYIHYRSKEKNCWPATEGIWFSKEEKYGIITYYFGKSNNNNIKKFGVSELVPKISLRLNLNDIENSQLQFAKHVITEEAYLISKVDMKKMPEDEKTDFYDAVNLNSIDKEHDDNEIYFINFGKIGTRSVENKIRKFIENYLIENNESSPIIKIKGIKKKKMENNQNTIGSLVSKDMYSSLTKNFKSNLEKIYSPDYDESKLVDAYFEKFKNNIGINDTENTPKKEDTPQETKIENMENTESIKQFLEYNQNHHENPKNTDENTDSVLFLDLKKINTKKHIIYDKIFNSYPSVNENYLNNYLMPFNAIKPKKLETPKSYFPDYIPNIEFIKSENIGYFDLISIFLTTLNERSIKFEDFNPTKYICELIKNFEKTEFKPSKKEESETGENEAELEIDTETPLTEKTGKTEDLITEDKLESKEKQTTTGENEAELEIDTETPLTEITKIKVETEPCKEETTEKLENTPEAQTENTQHTTTEKTPETETENTQHTTTKENLETETENTELELQVEKIIKENKDSLLNLEDLNNPNVNKNELINKSILKLLLIKDKISNNEPFKEINDIKETPIEEDINDLDSDEKKAFEIHDDIKNTINKREKLNKNIDEMQKTQYLMYTFITSIRNGSKIENICKKLKISQDTIKEWSKKGEEGDENYLKFYSEYKKLENKDPNQIKKEIQIKKKLLKHRTAELDYILNHENIKVQNLTDEEKCDEIIKQLNIENIENYLKRFEDIAEKSEKILLILNHLNRTNLLRVSDEYINLDVFDETNSEIIGKIRNKLNFDDVEEFLNYLTQNYEIPLNNKEIRIIDYENTKINEKELMKLNTVKEVLLNVLEYFEPEIIFNEKDLEDLEYNEFESWHIIGVLKDYNLIKIFNNDNYSLKSREELDKFLDYCYKVNTHNIELVSFDMENNKINVIIKGKTSKTLLDILKYFSNFKQDIIQVNTKKLENAKTDIYIELITEKEEFDEIKHIVQKID